MGKNGYFQLVNKRGGTYIKIYPDLNGANSELLEDIIEYMHLIKIEEYDLRGIKEALITIKEPVELRIGITEIPPVRESVLIDIDLDKMAAVARFYAPSTSGVLMEKKDIMSELVKAGVKYGVIQENIDSFLNHRIYCKRIILAQATPAIEGKNAEITYNFKVGQTAKPKLNADGTVDFHQLDMINHVNKGDILAKLEPVDYGKPGIDVCGNVLKPKKVNNKALKHGLNIHLSEDGTLMYSDVSGHVSLVDDRVFVSDTFEVTDVCAATGDISYAGNVSIKGNVITGFVVQAKGDIIVEGVVEGATLIADGQIILKRGIQGMNRGVLDAKGNIIAKYIENSEVKAGGTITTEAILHSKVSAKGEIIVNGKKGLITGGEIKSGTQITTKTVGSAMGTHTLLEVGIDPTVMDTYRKLEKSIADMRDEKEKIKQVLFLFRKRIEAGEQLSEKKIDYLRKANQNNIILDTQIKEACLEFEVLRNEINNYQSGRVKIENIAYLGVKIVISNVIYYVRSETQHCQFVRDKADIKMLPL